MILILRLNPHVEVISGFHVLEKHPLIPLGYLGYIPVQGNLALKPARLHLEVIPEYQRLLSRCRWPEIPEVMGIIEHKIHPEIRGRRRPWWFRNVLRPAPADCLRQDPKPASVAELT